MSMTVNDDDLRKIVKHDPLHEVEKLTGSYRDNPEMSMAFAFSHNQKKGAALKSANDTHFGMTLAEFEGMLSANGFEQVLNIDFEHPEYPATESLRIWFHAEDTLLLRYDTYGADRVNGGNIYFCWRPNKDDDDTCGLTSSGSCDKQGDWTGSADVREGLFLHLRGLREHGELIPWKHKPWLWLLHFKDTKDEGYDHEAIGEARIAMLPEHVRKAISGDAHTFKIEDRADGGPYPGDLDHPGDTGGVINWGDAPEGETP